MRLTGKAAGRAASLKLALSVAALLALAAPLQAQEAAGKEAGGKDHSHSHEAKASAANPDAAALARFAKGYFEDGDVGTRAISDWDGEWRSVWPLHVSGALDPVWVHKAEHGDKTAEEYKAYYETGYRSDIERIDIEGEHIRFHSAGSVAHGIYASDGYEILTYPKGNRGVRFIFKKTSGDAAAPAFIQFSDHIIAPQKSDHYHIYMGEDRAALLSELSNWPTFYPNALSDEQIIHEMVAH